MVQVDATTYRRLRDRFDFYEPQTLYLKGKGEMAVYRLAGKRPRMAVAYSADRDVPALAAGF
jgi:hypothetical protein